VDQIPRIAPNEISNAMPDILAALAHQDDNVKSDALLALFAVAQRADSAALLRSHVDVIGHDLLNATTTKPETRAGEMAILGMLKPSPPPEVVPIFLTFLNRRDAEAQAQGSAVIFELVHIAPENPEVVAAVRDFLSQTLDSKSRIDVLNALGNSRVKDAQIIAMMIRALDDPDQGVRFTAAQALAGVGRSALQQAEPTLQRLADDPKQPADVRAAAKEALQRLHPGQ
jgi:HEAT repeat protein